MNKLEEKFYKAMDENLDEQGCAICAAITKEEMKNFAEWLQSEEWEATIFTKGTFKKRHQDATSERKTTEELIKLYFNSEQP